MTLGSLVHALENIKFGVAIQICTGKILSNHFEKFQNFSQLSGKVGIQKNHINLMSLISSYF